ASHRTPARRHRPAGGRHAGAVRGLHQDRAGTLETGGGAGEDQGGLSGRPEPVQAGFWPDYASNRPLAQSMRTHAAIIFIAKDWRNRLARNLIRQAVGYFGSFTGWIKARPSSHLLHPCRTSAPSKSPTPSTISPH